VQFFGSHNFEFCWLGQLARQPDTIVTKRGLDVAAASCCYLAYASSTS
jgi:hypothetical protein